MAEKLNDNELKWLREIADSDDRVEKRISQATLGRLLKSGLVKTQNMLTLRLTSEGRKCLAAEAEQIDADEMTSRPVRYALFAESPTTAHLQQGH